MNYTSQVIKDWADAIKKKIKDGHLYGQPIDLDNISHLILAAYLLGQAEEREVCLSDIGLFDNIRRVRLNSGLFHPIEQKFNR